MPVKKKAAAASASKSPKAKAPAGKTPAGTRPAAKKTGVTSRKRALPDEEGVPASSLPPAVLPPAGAAARPAGRARAAKKAAADSPGAVLARAVADAADQKKGESITILDVRGLSMVTDFLVIVSASSMPHLRAIRNEIAERIREEREEKPHSAQGMAESHWLLLDYGDVVAHIFLGEKRELYALEDLWSDAPRLAWQPS